MKAAFISLLLVFTLFLKAGAQSAGTTVPNAEYIFLHSLPDSNAVLRRDSIRLTASYAAQLHRYRADSSRHALLIRKVIDSLAARQKRVADIKQQLDATQRARSADEAEISRIEDDSLAYAKTTRAIKDSLGEIAVRKKQYADPVSKSAALHRQLAAVNQVNRLLDSIEKRASQRLGLDKARIARLEDSLKEMDATEGRLPSVKAENEQVAKKTLDNFKQQVGQLTNGMEFSAQPIAALQARGQRLTTFYRNTPEFDACMDRLHKFRIVAAAATGAISVLENPYESVSCQEAIKALNGVEALTADQTTLIEKYRLALSNYGQLNRECFAAIQKASEYIVLKANNPAKVVLSGEKAKIDKMTYPFLYAEMNRLADNAEKGISLKDSRINATTP